MLETDARSSRNFILLVLGVALLSIVTTILIATMVTSSPRGFLAWITVLFICSIEFILALLAVNHFARAQVEYRASGPINASVWLTAVSYALIGFLGIVIYAALRGSSGANDHVFGAVLIRGDRFLFIVAMLMCGYDLYFQNAEMPSLLTRPYIWMRPENCSGLSEYAAP